jgi:hypothetical protein
LSERVKQKIRIDQANDQTQGDLANTSSKKIKKKKIIKQKINNDWLFYFAFINPENLSVNVEL